MAEKFCKHCHAPLAEEDRFCANCGAEVIDDENEIEELQPVEPEEDLYDEQEDNITPITEDVTMETKVIHEEPNDSVHLELEKDPAYIRPESSIELELPEHKEEAVKEPEDLNLELPEPEIKAEYHEEPVELELPEPDQKVEETVELELPEPDQQVEENVDLELPKPEEKGEEVPLNVETPKEEEGVAQSPAPTPIPEDITPKEEPEAPKKAVGEGMKQAGETVMKAASSVGSAVSQGAKAVSSSPITKNLLDICKNLFINPSGTIEKFANGKYFIEGWILIGLSALMTTLYLLRIVSSQTQSFTGYGPGSYYLRQIGPSMYFAFFLAYILGILIYAFLLWLFGRVIYRKKMTFKTTIASLGVVLTFTTIATLLGILLSFLSPTISTLLILFAGILGNIGVFISLLTAGGLKPNQAMYTMAFTAILSIVIISVGVALIFFQLLGNALLPF